MGLVAGLIYFAVNGKQYKAKGEFTYDLGYPKRNELAGADGSMDYTEEPKVSSIEGTITDDPALNLKTLVTLANSTVTLSLANGKTILIPGGTYAGEGTVKTKEAEIGVRFIGNGVGKEL